MGFSSQGKPHYLESRGRTQLPEYQHLFPSTGLWPRRTLGSRMLIQQVSKNPSSSSKTMNFAHGEEEP